jgi:LPXTG-motif cell wall-anchored protein
VYIPDLAVPLAGVTDWATTIIFLALGGGVLLLAGLVVKKRSKKQ